MSKKIKQIKVENIIIHITQHNKQDFICLTDMLKYKDSGGLIFKWLSNKNTIEFLGIWEKIYNPNFNYTEFGVIMSEAGVNRFTMSVKQWTERTNAYGIFAKTGRYGGTYAHKDIAFELGTWISPEFKLLVIREFQRLKEVESQQKFQQWDISRMLAKVNYRIHTDAIKANLIPPDLSKLQKTLLYADEADMLNLALLGQTAQMWQKQNPNKKGNMRDCATIEQLIVLANLESINAELIKMKLPQDERLIKLNQIARYQMKTLTQVPNLQKLKIKND